MENDAAWTERVVTESLIEIPQSSAAHDILLIQQAKQDKIYSPAYRYRYQTERDRWMLSEEKIHKSHAGLHLLAELPLDADYAFYTHNVGFDLQYGIHFSPLDLVSSVGYRYAQATTGWVTSFHELSMFVGLGYPLVLGKTFTLTPTLESGVLMHVVVGDLSGFQNSEVSLFLDPQLRLTLASSLLLTDNLRLTLKPYLLWYFEQAAVIFSSACSLGLEVLW